MPPDGFKRDLGLLDLTMIGFGAIFGSGWLFAAAHVADIAGPASLISWVIGGVAVLLIGLIYCELGAALPLTGGVVRYPEQSHGAIAGFLMGLITTIAFSSLIAIEIVAARQYAGAWIGGLTRDAAGDPTIAGWCAQATLLAVLFWINWRGIATFARVNTLMTIFKFCVPAMVVVMLLAHLHGSNFTAHGFAPQGAAGVQSAVATGGIIFAYLGLTPILSVASEVRHPQRTIPIALIASVGLSSIVYVLLQAAFIGALPMTFLAGGWTDIGTRLPLPFHNIAMALGLGTLATFVVADAMLSPAGTGNIYMSATPRVIYAWTRNGTFFSAFARVNPRTGVPNGALLLTFGLALFWTLPFPSWQALISVVSSALMLSYAFAPICAVALRRNRPDMERPFRVIGFTLLSPLAFAIATLIVLWTGWSTLRWLLPMLLGLSTIMLALRFRRDGRVTLRHDLRHTGWIFVYFTGLMVLSRAGPFGGQNHLSTASVDLATILFAVVIHEWAGRCHLPPATHHAGSTP
ncbi:MAG: APC family permease [Gluconacetobacter sp.]